MLDNCHIFSLTRSNEEDNWLGPDRISWESIPSGDTISSRIRRRMAALEETRMARDSSSDSDSEESGGIPGPALPPLRDRQPVEGLRPRGREGGRGRGGRAGRQGRGRGGRGGGGRGGNGRQILGSFLNGDRTAVRPDRESALIALLDLARGADEQLGIVAALGHSNRVTWTSNNIRAFFQVDGPLGRFRPVGHDVLRRHLKAAETLAFEHYNRPHSNDRTGANQEDIPVWTRGFFELFNSQMTRSQTSEHCRQTLRTMSRSLIGAQAPVGYTGTGPASLRTETSSNNGGPDTRSQEIGDMEIEREDFAPTNNAESEIPQRNEGQEVPPPVLGQDDVPDEGQALPRPREAPPPQEGTSNEDRDESRGPAPRRRPRPLVEGQDDVENRRRPGRRRRQRSRVVHANRHVSEFVDDAEADPSTRVCVISGAYSMLGNFTQALTQ